MVLLSGREFRESEAPVALSDSSQDTMPWKSQLAAVVRLSCRRLLSEARRFHVEGSAPPRRFVTLWALHAELLVKYRAAVIMVQHAA